MKLSLFTAAIAAGIVMFIIVAATGGSEEDLVIASYLALPLLVFGTAGAWAAKKNRQGGARNPIRFGLLLAAVAVLSLWLFYQQIWPML